MSTSLSRALRLAIRLIACGGLCASSAAEAQIYGSVASDGSVVLSNFRSEQARDIVVVDDGARRTVMPYAVMPDTRFSSLIHKAATETDLSPSLLHAVIAVESAFDERAVSPKGAKGLMQLMPATASCARSHRSLRSRTEHRRGCRAPQVFAWPLRQQPGACARGIQRRSRRRDQGGISDSPLCRDAGLCAARDGAIAARRRRSDPYSRRCDGRPLGHRNGSTCHARWSRRRSATAMRDHTSSEQRHAAGRALSR